MDLQQVLGSLPTLVAAKASGGADIKALALGTISDLEDAIPPGSSFPSVFLPLPLLRGKITEIDVATDEGKTLLVQILRAAVKSPAIRVIGPQGVADLMTARWS